uniref:Noggin n=1 Tax=Mastacembelus armatus TaxID=205130 RepID=A0A3Q3LQY4_9TELE
MLRLFNSVCLCRIIVSVLLCGNAAFISNISRQNQMPNVTIMESQFLHLRASLVSYSQPIRPYSLLTNAEDYHHMPKPRHRRPSQLLRLLGSSFDPFWMSINQPSEVSRGHSDGQPLLEAAVNHQQKLEKEAAELDLSSLPSDVASSVRVWLVRSATCELHYQWVDLGPAFWPRWLRQTDCEKSDGVHSCSFPSGMKCVRAQTTDIKILAWHCLEIGDGGDGSRQKKAEQPEGSTEMGTKEAMKRCLWRQVPYPVVTACTCSCK